MKEKIKLYDKKISKTSENIKSIMLILLAFIIGFAAAYVVNQKEIEHKNEIIINQYIELDSLKESVYMYELYGGNAND